MRRHTGDFAHCLQTSDADRPGEQAHHVPPTPQWTREGCHHEGEVPSLHETCKYAILQTVTLYSSRWAILGILHVNVMCSTCSYIYMYMYMYMYVCGKCMCEKEVVGCFCYKHVISQVTKWFISVHLSCVYN